VEFKFHVPNAQSWRGFSTQINSPAILSGYQPGQMVER
jgi:hypothetical protein